MLRDIDHNKGKYKYKTAHENIRIKLVDNQFLTSGIDPNLNSFTETKHEFYDSKTGPEGSVTEHKEVQA